MTESQAESPAESKPADDRGRTLPSWAWVLISVLLLGLVVLAVLLLIRFGPTTPTDLPTSTAESTPSATATETPTPVPTPTPTPPSDQGTFDADMSSIVLEILNSGNTAVFAQGGYFSNPILVSAAASGLNEPMTPDDAVGAMQFLVNGQADNSWSLATDADLAIYRAGPYGGHFPEGAIVAKSVNSHVVSFIGDQRTITIMFIVGVTDTLNP
jgi:hypothetical protein